MAIGLFWRTFYVLVEHYLHDGRMEDSIEGEREALEVVHMVAAEKWRPSSGLWFHREDLVPGSASPATSPARGPAWPFGGGGGGSASGGGQVWRHAYGGQPDVVCLCADGGRTPWGRSGALAIAH